MLTKCVNNTVTSLSAIFFVIKTLFLHVAMLVFYVMTHRIFRKMLVTSSPTASDGVSIRVKKNLQRDVKQYRIKSNVRYILCLNVVFCRFITTYETRTYIFLFIYGRSTNNISNFLCRSCTSTDIKFNVHINSHKNI